MEYLFFLYLQQYFWIPIVATLLLKYNISTKKIYNKKGLPSGRIRIPEALGIVPGIIYLTTVIIFHNLGVGANDTWPFYSGVLTIAFSLILGFSDDICELRWRTKLFLSTLPALVLASMYDGGSVVLLPKPFQSSVGTTLIDLGYLYQTCLFLLTIFFPNSINILAGINGLEVGQSIIIAVAVIIDNIIQIMLNGSKEHSSSLFLMQPFLAISLGLYAFNRYPSKVFVGDTYTYFAGIVFAVVGIQRHFCETLIFFFLPQLLNFVYSLPQL